MSQQLKLSMDVEPDELNNPPMTWKAKVRILSPNPEQNSGNEEATQRNEENPQACQSGDGMAFKGLMSNIKDQQDTQANSHEEVRGEDANFQQHQAQAPFMLTSAPLAPDGFGGVHCTKLVPR